LTHIYISYAFVNITTLFATENGKREKEHFHHYLLLYCFNSKKLPHLFISETYSESVPLLKHVSIDFDDSKVMILKVQCRIVDIVDIR